MPTLNYQDKTATFPIALVVSRFNEPVTQALLEGAQARLDECGFTQAQITIVSVPGVVEIPLMLQQLAKSNQHQALVALGAVIRGETTHYDYVCDQVSQGCARVALDFDIPVIFGVLTTENAEQAMARCGGDKGHKGREAIDCAMEMTLLMESLSS